MASDNNRVQLVVKHPASGLGYHARMQKTALLLVVGLTVAMGAGTAAAKHAKPKPASKAEDKKADDGAKAPAADDKAGDEEAAAPAEKPEFTPIEGPQKVDAGHEVMIDLPPGYLFLDKVQATKFMEQHGNLWNDDLLGVVMKDEATWLVTIRYTEEGYVKDDEAEKMDAEEILNAIKEGTTEANKERVQRGFKALNLLGWSEPPRYQKDVHHLVWGIKGHTDGDDDDTINFNTRVLGRKGYVALNLIDGSKTIEGSKPAVATLLAATTFKPGSSYADFDKKTDKIAEYGLAALVAGGAGAAALKLVKIGLLAKFGTKILAILIAAKKAIILAIAALFAFIKKLFGGKQAQPAPASASVEQKPTEGGPGSQGGA
jgi:uncharacterized membrane-anchored protein